MSDPASAAASVAGLLSLALQSLQYLIQFYMSCKDRDSEIETTLTKLDGIQQTLCILKDMIQKRTWQPDELAVLHNIELSVTHIESGIDKLNTRIEKIRKFHKNDLLKSVQDCSRRVLYPFQKGTLEKLGADVDFYRENLALALHVLQTMTQQDILCGVKDVQKGVDLLHARKMNDDLREWLGAPNAIVNYSRAREMQHTGTGRWFIESPKFTEWLNSNNSFLWIHGFQGCGKTILCSTAIENTFHRRRSQPGNAIAFFFFAFDDGSKQDSSALLRGLILQLSDQVEGVDRDLAQLRSTCNSGSLTSAALLKCLYDALLRTDHLYIFLDAIEECTNPTRREEVMSIIRTVRRWAVPSLHLMVTSRDLPDIRLALDATPDQTIAMKNRAVDVDIEAYITHRLDNDPSLRRWTEYRTRIKEHLTQHAGGVFRWAVCQLEPLRHSPKGQKRLERCLRSLPETLDATYERMLCSIGPECRDEARRLLTLLCYSSRPMTVAEVIDALAVDPDHSQCFDAEERLEDAEDLNRLCPGLIEIYSRPLEYYEMDDFLKRYDPATSGAKERLRIGQHDSDPEVTNAVQTCSQLTSIEVVRISHFSVQEYLVSDRIRNGQAFQFAISDVKGHSEICRTFLIYLYNQDFVCRTLTIGLVKQFPLARLAAKDWYYHYQRADVDVKCSVQKQALKLLTDEATFERSIQLHDVDIPWHSFDYHMINFDSYSERNYPSPIYYASLLGSMSLLRDLMLVSPEHLNDRTGYYGSALRAASANSHGAIVQLLLEEGANVNAVGGEDDYGGTALEEACRQGNMVLAKYLLDQNADPNVPGKVSFPLMEASRRGCEATLHSLIEAGADVNARGRRNNPLVDAVDRADEYVAKLLLSAGADVNARQEANGWTALSTAVSHHNCSMVKILIEHGADVNVGPKNNSSTALTHAAYQGYEEMVRMLLEAGADVNISRKDGLTALSLASGRGHEKITRALLERGANATFSPKNTEAAILHAAWGGHRAIAEMLKARGADVNKMHWKSGHNWEPALIVASRSRRINTVRILLDLGADVNVTNKGILETTTALQEASRQGDTEIVELLLACGADPNLCHPLRSASEAGHDKVIQILLDHNVEVNDGGGVCSIALEMAARNAKDYSESKLATQTAQIHGKDPTRLVMIYTKITKMLVERGARYVHELDDEDDWLG